MSAPVGIGPARKNIEHLLQVIEFFFVPGDVIELRALNVGRSADRRGETYAGYFNVENTQAITEAIRSVYDRADGIYFVLNRINPELLARSNNHLTRGPKNTTSDADILERRWFPIDVDPRQASRYLFDRRRASDCSGTGKMDSRTSGVARLADAPLR